MANCPFCNSEIDEMLLLHGGTCPKCFGEIPGEEAPTDPGEEVKKKQEAADRRGLRLRGLLMAGALGILVSAVVCGAVGLVVWPKDEPMAAINFDDYAGWEDLEELAFEEAAPEAVVATNDAGSKAKSNGGAGGTKPKANPGDKLKVGGGFDLGTPDINGDLAAAGPDGVKGPRGPRSGSTDALPTGFQDPTAGTTSGMSSGLNTLGGGGMGPKRREIPNITLTDDNEIITMVARVLSTEMRGLKSCYDQDVKTVDEPYSGRWVVSLTVGKDGAPKKIDVSPAEGTTARDGLQSCMVSKVERWRFQPIKAELPVQKSARFSPS